MTWPLWLRQKVRDFVDLAAQGAWPQMRDQARRLAREIPPEEPRVPGARASSRAKPRGGVDKSGLPFAPNVGPSQRDRKGERNERMRVLRIRVLRRARGRCEFRCAPPGMPTDAHHVFGGSDRRELESEYTLAGICEDCHGKCNASPAWAREQGLAWARRMAAASQVARDAVAVAGFTATAELLEGRIALAEAQARAPTTEDDAA